MNNIIKPFLVNSVMHGFTLYGKDYDIKKCLTNPLDALGLKQMEMINWDAEVQNLREWELAALDFLTDNVTGDVVPSPPDPWQRGYSYDSTEKDVFMFSTERGSICLIHNDGGIHNCIINHPNDVYTITAIVAVMEAPWCYASKDTRPLWNKLGFEQLRKHCGHYLLVKNNSKDADYPFGSRMNIQQWEKLRVSIEDANCTIWQLSDR